MATWLGHPRGRASTGFSRRGLAGPGGSRRAAADGRARRCPQRGLDPLAHPMDPREAARIIQALALGTDPYTGESLHVKKTPQGWLVYSVGRNLKDDGGKVEDPTNGDVGVGPPPAAAKPAEPAKK